ncbi:MAG: pilus assembly protein HicB [Planctomycetota bacterium]|jgi:hypothetical protein
MKASDRYHKRVDWIEENQVFLGRCPDLITAFHGSELTHLHAELCQVVEEVIEHFEASGRALSPSRTRPMKEVV